MRTRHLMQQKYLNRSEVLRDAATHSEHELLIRRDIEPRWLGDLEMNRYCHILNLSLIINKHNKLIVSLNF
jgi:hypothetical protein